MSARYLGTDEPLKSLAHYSTFFDITKNGSRKRAITPITIGGFYPLESDLYFMIIYPNIKYESNILIFSKDIEREPFFVHADGRWS